MEFPNVLFGNIGINIMAVFFYLQKSNEFTKHGLREPRGS